MNIRKLTENDLSMMEHMASEKFSKSQDNLQFLFSDTSGLVFKLFVVPENVYGHDKLQAYGYFDEDNKLLGMIGYRNIDYQPSWVLSFIVTSIECKNSLQIIKKLLDHVLTIQEAEGKYQWFVISKLDKFKSWQRLFNGARSNYHHYVYARVLANNMPKWLNILQLSGNKLFPYDINVSMYVSRKICTSDEEVEFDESDCLFF